jgi:hypothetical protein
MKANLKRKLGLAALCLGLFTNAVPTWAGYVRAYRVTIFTNPNTNFKSAGGTMVGARCNADQVEHIGYFITATPLVICQARDSAGAYLGCLSSAPTMLDAVQRMTDSSVIRFTVAPGTTTCAHIAINNSSSALK